jgi:hypothetical protein
MTTMTPDTMVIRHDLTPHLRGTTTYPAGWSPRREPGSPDLVPLAALFVPQPEPGPEPVDIDLDEPAPTSRRRLVYWGRHRPPVPMWTLVLLFAALAMVAGAVGGGLVLGAAVAKAGGTW